MLTQKGQLDAAEAAIREAIAAAPEAAPFHAHLGSLLERRGDTAGALAALSRAVELDPESAQLRQRLGRLQARHDR
jgi:Flp pilus assembly protein TadD